VACWAAYVVRGCQDVISFDPETSERGATNMLLFATRACHPVAIAADRKGCISHNFLDSIDPLSFFSDGLWI